MTEHDRLCHARPTLDPERCAECEQLAAARTDERAKAHVHATGTSTGDGPCCECCYDVPALYNLRAKVEGLPHGFDNDGIYCASMYAEGSEEDCDCSRGVFLALFDGASDG
jgi:hypothetical protein